jgi:dTDP-4-amino-4,6-dideoxygalactose transaminase
MFYNKKIKWATQSFSFPSSACNNLSDVVIIDIDQNGAMDINKIPENIDGIIITNVFGNVCDINKYVEWCKHNNKILLFDNAATPYTFYNGSNSCNYGLGSIISFHHTKQFGFGEGGAIIINKEYEKTIRKILNFGIDNQDYYKKQNWHFEGANYKMSEISAIFIYQYIYNNFEQIINHHKKLYNYAKTKKINMYPNFSDEEPFVSCIVFLDDKFTLEYIQNKISLGYFCRKYYNPLKETTNANIFYNKIFCIPCNLDMTEQLLDKYL